MLRNDMNDIEADVYSKNETCAGFKPMLSPAALGRDSHGTSCTATSHLIVAYKWLPRSLLECVYLTECAQIPFSPRAL